MSVLKGLSRLEMRFYVQDGLIMESFAFVNDCIQKCSFYVRDFSREFNCRMV